MRTALLSAVSHDLRTPLASAKAAVDQPAQRGRRLQRRRPGRAARHRRGVAGPADPAGGEPARHEPAAGRRARRAPAADQRRGGRSRAPSTTLGEAGRDVTVHVPDDLAEVRADPGLLERILVNVLANAVRLQPARPAADRHRQRARRHGRAPRHRPRPRHPGRRPGAGLPAVPAPRRPRQRHRRRARPRPVPRPGRGDGRHPAAGEHPRRRAHHDPRPARRRAAADAEQTADPAILDRLDDPRIGHRRVEGPA